MCGNLALAELRSATGSLEAVLKLSFTQFSLIFRAFQRFHSPVILFITDKKGEFQPKYYCPKASFTTLQRSSGLLYLTFA